jgi:hypothetical protein
MQSATVTKPLGITVPINGSSDAQLSVADVDLNKTWNFLIPASLVTQDLVAIININRGLSVVPECPVCASNNRVEVHLHFRSQDSIVLNPVYFHFTGSYQTQSCTDQVPATSQFDSLVQLMNRLYPFHVSQGPRYDRTVGPGTGGDDLLDRVNDVASDFGIFQGPPDNSFYLGLITHTGTCSHLKIDDENKAGEAYVGSHAAWADSADPIAAAHEVMHDIGFDHWACENGVTDDECGVFPIAHGGLGGIGFDSLNWRLIVPGDNSSNSTPHAHDLMSYGRQCGSFTGVPNCNTGEWISWYDYQILLDNHTADSYDTDDPPALWVIGAIDAAGGVSFRPVYQASVSRPVTDTLADENEADDIYTLHSIDTRGNTVSVHNFTPRKTDVHTADYSKIMHFNETLPMQPNLGRLELRHGATLMGQLVNPSPGQPPSVSITSPSSGAVWPAGTLQTIRWNSAFGCTTNCVCTNVCPPGPPPALVEYSPDGGTTRLTLAHDLRANELTISPDELPQSTNATIYVQVSDGFNATQASVNPFTVLPKPPRVHITYPQTDSQVGFHVPLTLEGTITSPPSPPIPFSWTSDRDGALGTGQQLTTAKLSLGLHTLTLRVTDGNGLTGQDSVRVQVSMPTGCATVLTADINGDCIVDIRDYGVWRQNFGATDCGNPADLNGDCTADIRDYGVWRQHFGETGAAAARSSSGTPPGSPTPARTALLSPTPTGSASPTFTPVPGRSPASR